MDVMEPSKPLVNTAEIYGGMVVPYWASRIQFLRPTSASAALRTPEGDTQLSFLDQQH